MQQVSHLQPVTSVSNNTINTQQNIGNDQTPNMQQVMNNVQETDINYVDPSVRTLSTGYTVKLNKIPKPISDEFVTSIFGETELDGDNNIILDKIDSTEQFRLTGKIMELYTSIIGAGGVTLIDELPDEDTWLDQILFSPTITNKYPHINWSKLRQKDKHFLFLRYFCFAEKDWELLSKNCLN